MARLYTIIAAIFMALSLHAQELEYGMELGVMGGPSFYMGDANLHGFYKNTTIAGGLMGRYNINPRMSLKFNLAYGKIKGDATKGDNKFPATPEQAWNFDNALIDAGCQYELSFWGFGTGTGLRMSRRGRTTRMVLHTWKFRVPSRKELVDRKGVSPSGQTSRDQTGGIAY